MPSDRSFSQGAWLGGTIALALGIAAVLLHRGGATLVSPATCPGIFDATAALSARLAPTLSLGVWLLRANALLLLAAVTTVVLLLRAVSSSWMAAGAAGLAIAALPVLNPTLSLFDPAALIVAAATCALILTGRSPAIGFLATALVVPQAGLLLAALTGVYMLTVASTDPARPRWPRAALWTGVVALTSIALSMLIPDLPPPVGSAGASCLVPPLTAPAAAAWLGGLRLALASAGPYGFGLAAVGAFSLAQRHRTRSLAVLAYAILPAVSGVSVGGAPLTGIATALVAWWACMAVGLREVVGACRAGVGGRVAATILVVLLPLFQLIRPAPETTNMFGAERVSLNDIRQLLAVLPDEGMLVSEDATTAVLLRGMSGAWTKMGKALHLVPRDSVALSAALARPGARAFALPAAQTELQWLGFSFANANLAGVSGVAEVTRGGACQRTRPRWLEWADLQKAHALSILGGDLGEDHAVVLYAASDRALAPATLGWPPTATGGFHPSSYVLSDEADRVRLDRDTRDDELPPDAAVRRGPFVTRLKMWRSSETPEVLPVDLGGAPSATIVRGWSTNVPGVSVCPAFPGTISR